MSWTDWILPPAIQQRIAAWAIQRALSGKSLVDEWELDSGKRSDDPEGQYMKAYNTYVWAYACIEAKMKFAAMVPLVLKQVTDWDDLDSAEPLKWNHPARELWRRVNPINVPYQFIASMVCYMATEGEWYCRKDDGRGDGTFYKGPPTELWLLPPNRMEKKLNPDGTIRQFVCRTAGGRRIPYDPKEIVWMYNFNPLDHYKGLSSLRPIERSIETDLEAQNVVKYGLKRGMQIDAAFESDHPKPANDRQLIKDIQMKHVGPMSMRRFVMLWDGLKYKAMGKTPAEYGMGDIRDRDMLEALVSTGVPKGELGLEVSNRSVIEEHARKFAQRTMQPEMEMYLQFLNEFLWADFGDNIVSTWDWSKVPALQEDQKQKCDIACAYVDRGIWTREEAREFTGKQATPDDGQLLVPYNLIPYDAASIVSSSKAIEGGEKARGKRPEWTPAEVARLRTYERRVTTLERQVATWLEVMFDEQEEAVLKAFRRSKRGPEDLLDEALLLEIAEPVLRRAIYAAMQEGVKHGMDPLDFIDFVFDLDADPRLLQWLETEAFRKSKIINGFTMEKIAKAHDAITDAVAEGLPQKDVEGILRSVFDARRGNVKTIARTEVTSAMSHTEVEVWKESQVVTAKRWLSSFHSESRHDALHRQEVPLEASFINPVTGGTIEAPGIGDPGEAINCLCDMVPVVDTERKVDVLIKDITDRLLPLDKAGEGSRKWAMQKKVSGLTKAR